MPAPQLFLAVCRECLGAPGPCWRCHGVSVFRVQTEAEADLVLECALDATGIAFTLGSRFTERFRCWLAELQAPE